MQLGTYSTIDCPIKKQEEAFNWLQDEFEKIDGIVKTVMNPHDFGPYPSFEINYPEEVEEAKDFIDLHEGDEIDEIELTQEEWDKQEKIVDDWHNEANRIETEYNKKFGKYL